MSIESRLVALERLVEPQSEESRRLAHEQFRESARIIYGGEPCHDPPLTSEQFREAARKIYGETDKPEEGK